MNKRVMSLALALTVVAATAFAGGEAESGRGNAIDDIGEGQLISFDTIDSEAYLSEFAFERETERGELLSAWVELEATSVLNCGELLALRIALRTAPADQFPEAEGSYVFFFQDPGLLGELSVRRGVAQLIDGNPRLDYHLYDPDEQSLRAVEDGASFQRVAQTLSRAQKRYDNQRLLHELLDTASDELEGERRHVIWVTDENVVETSQDARMFSFSVNLLGGADISFSYLGYGEVPSWQILNDSLGVNNGNSYFADDTDEILEKIEDDIGYFAVPAVEDVSVVLRWSGHVSTQATYYPSRHYRSVSGFSARFNNGRPTAGHYRGGMNYDEIQRFIHYVRVPATITMTELGEDNPVDRRGRYQIGTVFLWYTIEATGERRYEELPIAIQYTDSLETEAASHNEYVLADTIIQNTPLVLKEVAWLINSQRNYLTSLELLQAQTLLLTDIRSVREDEAIDEDIEMLNATYDLLFEQARTLNLIMTE
jgi:hypothetical protein